MKNKTFYQRNSKGQYYAGISQTKVALLFITLIVIGTGLLYSVLTARARATPMLSDSGSIEQHAEQAWEITSGSTEKQNYIRSSDGTTDLTDDATKIRIYELTEKGTKQIKWYGKTREIEVIRTRYSRTDSCHYKRGEECLTAIGKDTKEGRTVACPYSLKLGTKILLDGKEYICEDRYAKRLDAKRGLPTIDVFAEAPNLNKLPAYKKTVAIIYE